MAGNGAGPVLTRREVVAASTALGAAVSTAKSQERRVALGVIGCGGRGSWIARLFARHGGYSIHAIADYFPEVAQAVGESLGVPAARRFSGLSGYKRLLDTGVEAVALEAPPCFYPAHARAAVEAGKHVYVAKPVAADVPGALAMEETAKRAQTKGLVFLVDYQIPTDPANIAVVRQIHAGAIGKVVAINSQYLAGSWQDPPFTANLESRLRNLIWVNDTAIGSGYHGNACIHAIQAAMWVANGVPTAAMGISRIGRPSPHGDSHDVYALCFEFPNGVVLNHRAKHLNDRLSGYDFCACLVHGQNGSAYVTYTGNAWLIAENDALREEVPNLYEAGAVRNIAEFHRCINERDTANPTVRYAVDSCLATILGREAARRRTRLTMRDILRENRSLPVNLKGLKD